MHPTSYQNTMHPSAARMIRSAFVAYVIYLNLTTISTWQYVNRHLTTVRGVAKEMRTDRTSSSSISSPLLDPFECIIHVHLCGVCCAVLHGCVPRGLKDFLIAFIKLATTIVIHRSRQSKQCNRTTILQYNHYDILIKKSYL